MLATGRPSVRMVALVADGTVSPHDDAYTTRGHILHQGPQIERVSVVAYDRSTRFRPTPNPGHILLMVSVKYNRRATDDIVFHELMEIAVGSVESDEVGVVG